MDKTRRPQAGGHMATSTTHRSAEAQKVPRQHRRVVARLRAAHRLPRTRRVSDGVLSSCRKRASSASCCSRNSGTATSAIGELLRAVRRIASACGSAGWVAGIIGVHNWHLALFDQAQEEVWGKDTDVRISSSYAPMGIGEVVDGG